MKKLFLLFFGISFCFSQDSTRIMLFGNSITELNWQGGYRSYLYKSLDSAGYLTKFVGNRYNNHDDGSLGFTFPASHWRHEGITGKTAGSWSGQAYDTVGDNVPDIMFLEIGTNDCANGSKTRYQMRDTISKLIDTIFAAAGDTLRMVFSNMPQIYPTGTGFTQAKEDSIEALNSLFPALVASKVASGKYVVMVDMFSALTEEAHFDGDGIHPSVYGYHVYRNTMLPAIIQALDSVVTPSSASKYLLWKK